MPSALIEVRRPWSAEEEVAIIDAVHGGLMAAFRIPAQDRDVRLVSHEPHRFACSPRHSQPEFFTLVSIDCFSGRSVQAKRNLYTEIVDRLAGLGIPRDHVTVIQGRSGRKLGDPWRPGSVRRRPRFRRARVTERHPHSAAPGPSNPGNVRHWMSLVASSGRAQGGQCNHRHRAPSERTGIEVFPRVVGASQ